MTLYSAHWRHTKRERVRVCRYGGFLKLLAKTESDVFLAFMKLQVILSVKLFDQTTNVRTHTQNCKI